MPGREWSADRQNCNRNVLFAQAFVPRIARDRRNVAKRRALALILPQLSRTIADAVVVDTRFFETVDYHRVMTMARQFFLFRVNAKYFSYVRG